MQNYNGRPFKTHLPHLCIQIVAMQIRRQGTIGCTTKDIKMAGVVQHHVAVAARRRRAGAAQEVLRAHTAPAAKFRF